MSASERSFLVPIGAQLSEFALGRLQPALKLVGPLLLLVGPLLLLVGPSLLLVGPSLLLVGPSLLLVHLLLELLGQRQECALIPETHPLIQDAQFQLQF